MASIIKTNSKDLAPYLKDASNFKGFAERLIIPQTEQDISDILREHYEKKLPITVTGNHTGLTGASVAQGGSILATERFSNIKAVEESFAIVEPGVTLSDLFKTLEAKQLLYPPDPGEWKAFLGGTVATNASGPRAFKYGTTRRWIKRLRVVLTTGEILDIPRGRFIADTSGKVTIGNRKIQVPYYLPPVSKSVIGYMGGPGADLIDLFIGSEGTLGVTTEIEIGLLPLPEDVFALIAFFPTEESAWKFCTEARKVSRAVKVNDAGEIREARSIEYFDEGSIDFLRPHYPHIPTAAKAAIYLEQEFKQDKRELLTFWFDLIRSAKGFAADTWVAGSSDDREEFREFRHALPELVSKWLSTRNQRKIGTDIAVPPENFERLMNFKKEALKNSGIRYVTFGHIGDSHVHLNMLPQNEQERIMAKRLYSGFLREAVKLGGTISAEHGIGKLKREYLGLMLGREVISDMVRFKKEFDPHMILNRGNLFTDEMLIDTI